VSVIIPTYNSGRFIGEALASIFAQTVPVSEIIVVDDGSTDDTPRVLRTMTDPRIKHLTIPHSGISVARNTGIQAASGEVIAFLDSDDRWRPEKLERQLAVLLSEPEVGVVFSDFIRFNENGFLPNQFSFMPELSTLRTRPSSRGEGHVVLPDAFCQLVNFGEIPGYTQTLLIRRVAVAGVLFPPDLRVCEDLYFSMRVYEKTQVAFVGEPLVEVRRHSTNVSRPGVEMAFHKLKALETLMKDVQLPDHREAVRVRVGRQLLAIGYHYFWQRSPAQAARYYLRAARYPGCRSNALAHLLALPVSPFLKRRNDND
jgi:glycosyltransferase involved in cell wall biosynthesis